MKDKNENETKKVRAEAFADKLAVEVERLKIAIGDLKSEIKIKADKDDVTILQNRVTALERKTRNVA